MDPTHHSPRPDQPARQRGNMTLPVPRLLLITTGFAALCTSTAVAGTDLAPARPKNPVTTVEPKDIDVVKNGAATQGSPAASAVIKEKSIYDRVWGLMKLYNNPENPVIQELAICGRYHGQFHMTEADSGNYSNWENRRFRAGVDAKLFHNFDFRAQFESNDPFSVVYSQFTELYLTWNQSDAFHLTLGRQKPRFSYEWDTSSRNILTFERSMLVNQFKPNYSTGISAAGKINHWIYYAGAFSNAPDEVLGVGGGTTGIATVGYDLKDAWDLDKAEWRVQYLHSSHCNQDIILNYFSNGLATNLLLKQDRMGLNAELLLGLGDKSDAFGVMLMPTFDLTDKLELVARYQFANSNEPAGLSGQRRYEKESGGTGGNLYNAIYLGFNYRIYGDKLKLLGGVEYANMQGDEGFDGYTFLSGVRVYW